jgi:hypothetical protein
MDFSVIFSPFPFLLWFPLSTLHSTVLHSQKALKQKILNYKVFSAGKALLEFNFKFYFIFGFVLFFIPGKKKTEHHF